jgi:hypothetical protein
MAMSCCIDIKSPLILSKYNKSAIVIFPFANFFNIFKSKMI